MGIFKSKFKINSKIKFVLNKIKCYTFLITIMQIKKLKLQNPY